MSANQSFTKDLPKKGQALKVGLRDIDEQVVLEPNSDLKTLDQCINVGDLSLQAKIMSAFHLAKSAGRELNVTFTSDAMSLP